MKNRKKMIKMPKMMYSCQVGRVIYLNFRKKKTKNMKKNEKKQKSKKKSKNEKSQKNEKN